MAIKIKPLRKFTTGTPSTSDMVEGELAVNTADKKVFMRDDSNNIVEVGAASSLSLPIGGGTLTGDVTFTGTSGNIVFDKSDDALEFADNVKAVFGAGNDMSIFHNGTNSKINNITGGLQIVNFADDKDVTISTDDGSGSTTNYFRADGSTGEALLYHYGSEKLKTESTGVTVTSTTDGGPVLNLISNDPDDAGDFDTEGKISFKAENSASESVEYANIQLKTADVTDGTENGWIYFGTVHQGTLANSLALGSSGSLHFLGTSGHDNHPHLQWNSTGGTSFDISLKTAVPSADRTITLPDATGTVLVDTGDQSITGDLTLISTDAGSAVDPFLKILRNSSSPANQDILGGLSFQGKNNNSEFINYGFIQARIRDVTDGSENGALETYVETDGTLDLYTVHQDGQSQFYKDVALISNDAGADESPRLDLFRNSASPAVSDSIGTIRFRGTNDAGQNLQYAEIQAQISDETDGTEDGSLFFQARNNGTLLSGLSVSGGAKRVNVGSDFDLFLQEDATIRFEGATSNDFEITLTVADPTADRTITFPDVSGTVLTTGNPNTITDIGVQAFDVQLGTGSDLIFEGATSNAHETTLTVTDPTADRTITLPDATGTVALTASPTFTGTLTTPAIRLSATGDVSPSSTSHPFQVGASNSSNIAMDSNEIMARFNGSTALLYLNAEGSAVVMGGGLHFQGDSSTQQISFEGSTDDSHEVFLKAEDATDSDKTITLPNATGTVLLDTGNQTLTGDLSFPDSEKVIFGTGSDLQIYHDGSNSFIADSGTGDLVIQATHLRLRSADTETYFLGTANGSVELYHNNIKKFETTSDGITVTGTTNAGALFANGSIGNTQSAKGVYAGLSTGGDAQIALVGDNTDVVPQIDFSHDVNIDYDIRLILQDTGNRLSMKSHGNETIADFFADGAVELYHDNIKKLSTTSDGVQILDNGAGSSAILELGTQSTTEGGFIKINGTTANKYSEIFTSNGNLHIDSAGTTSHSIYLNWYTSDGNSTTGGTVFGTGNGSQAAKIDGSGNLTISGTLNGHTVPSGSGTIALTTSTVSNVTVSDSSANTNFPVVFHDESNGLLDDTGALRYNPSTGTLLAPNLVVAGTTTTVNTVTMEAANAIVFEGATADAHETTLTITDPTADRTITLPNATGQVVLSSGTIDSDASAEIGRAHVGYVGWDDLAGFSHVDLNTQTSYSLLQGSTGITYLNAADGQTIKNRINNSTIFETSATGLTISSGKKITTPSIVTSGTIELSQTSGVAIKTTGALASADLTLLRASSDTAQDGQYGFDIRYMGSRSGNANSFALEMHNQQGTNVEAITVYQDGKVGINQTTPTAPLHVGGTSIFDDDVTLTGASGNIVFDKSDNALEFADNTRAKFGTGDDLQIYHNGSNTYIDDGSGTGALIFKSNTYSFRNAADDEQIAVFNEDGAVELYYNGSKKFQTRNNGFAYIDDDVHVEITNQANFGALEIGGSGGAFIDLKSPETDDYDARIQLNTSNNLSIFSDDFHLASKTAETYLDATANGAVNIYYDNSLKWFTKDTGTRVMGTNASQANILTYGPSSSPTVFTVKVVSTNQYHPYNGDGSSNKYSIDGEIGAAVELHGADAITSNSEYYYRFDQSDSSNSGHPLRFYLTADKTTEYTTGVTTNGTPGSSGAYTQIAVTMSTPKTLYYQCSAHAYMGNYVTVVNSSKFSEGITVSGGSSGDVLLTFDTDRSWQFQQSGDNASTRLQLKSSVGSKFFDIVTSSGDAFASFYAHDTTPSLTLTSTNADATEGPSLVLNRNSASPAVNDLLGNITFQGEDSGGSTVNYGRINGIITDPTDGSEDGLLRFQALGNGSLFTAYQIGYGGNFFYRDLHLMQNTEIYFEGSTDDDFETHLTVIDPTADRTITLPNATGTVITTGNADTPTTETSSGEVDHVLVNSGGTMKKITPSNLGIGGGGGGGGSTAADDLTAGDAAVNLTTSSGNITIDAQGSDTDIIFKGTDGSSDITALTLDMSDSGKAIFNAGAQFGGFGGGSFFSVRGSAELRTTGANILIRANSAQTRAELFFNGSEKLVTDTNGVTVTGTLNLNSAYTFPTSDGSANQVLQTDGSGTLSFATVSGGGGGGNADTLDNLDSTAFLRSNAADSFSGTLTGTAAIELNGGVTYDPSSTGGGSDTATDVAISIASGQRIVGHNSGYIRTLLEWNVSGNLDIGQNNTSLINQTNIYGGNGANSNGGVNLYHAANKKLATNSTGVTVTGLLTATTKSFDIKHPTKEHMRLRYGVLEGPEHGVYIRGKLINSNVIELPEHWTGLVDEDTITVQLTPIGKFQKLYVKEINDNKITIGNSSFFSNKTECFYFVQGTRKDVDELEIEYEN